MIAIFQDTLETSMDVFMDDFSIFGDSFDSCLTNLEHVDHYNVNQGPSCAQSRREVISWPKATYFIAVKGNQVNAVKASACWVWKPKTKGNPQQDLQEKGVIDSGCSRHMTGNMSYLTDFEEIIGGYVAFRGNPKGGKITSRVSRKNNMYSVDLKNIVPKGGLTYLFAKDTSDESILWHRRLGHINFKTMNKLVKGNLVRGLPSKRFEIHQTYIACQKGKQHRASCKFKTDETSGILKSFITGVEKLIDQRVKVINTKKHVDDAGDDEKKVTEEPKKEVARVQVKWMKEMISIELPDDLNMPELEDIVYSDDDEDVGAEADMNNLDAFRPERFYNSATRILVFIGLPMEKGSFWHEHGSSGIKRVYEVEKALYGLHQAPRAWYETLSTYLLDNGFKRGKIDKTLFTRREKGDSLLVQVYVDDIIFGSTKKSLCTEFEKMMHKKFQISYMGELTFFLGLQVKHKNDGVFISQDKYATKILKKFGFTDVKTTSTPMETQNPLLKDEDGEEVDVHLYRSMIGLLMYLTSSRPDIMFVVSYTNSDYAGASLNRKSTTGGCQFLGCRLISWQCKKQTVVANSIIEAEYVVASSCYSNEKKLIQMIKIHTDKNVADLLTKAFDVKTVNGEQQLQALVDGKKIVVTEASVRRDLQLDDEC
ncbi:putative ribonuclease H-like domain-containing protein [Tanacetum coccineum]|uniref:Ribonuclease H-like domain-containing protein n=1 Tax=Tanacetum coccineum TaxID=301880 RepID=A0ABQ4XJV2_9ASTR